MHRKPPRPFQRGLLRQAAGYRREGYAHVAAGTVAVFTFSAWLGF